MTTMNNEYPAVPSVHEQRELPEPAAWRVYFPDEQREEFASSLDDLLDDLTNCAHDDPEPLYTADQMREAIAAERERSHELLQAADHIRAGLEAELAALSAALVKVLDTREKEAKAGFAYETARDNFTGGAALESRRHLAMMQAASRAEKEARLLLATLKTPNRAIKRRDAPGGPSA